jgi:hypothetical protein
MCRLQQISIFPKKLSCPSLDAITLHGATDSPADRYSQSAFGLRPGYTYHNKMRTLPSAAAALYTQKLVTLANTPTSRETLVQTIAWRALAVLRPQVASVPLPYDFSVPGAPQA